MDANYSYKISKRVKTTLLSLHYTISQNYLHLPRTHDGLFRGTVATTSYCDFNCELTSFLWQHRIYIPTSNCFLWYKGGFGGIEKFLNIKSRTKSWNQLTSQIKDKYLYRNNWLGWTNRNHLQQGSPIKGCTMYMLSRVAKSPSHMIAVVIACRFT